MLDPDGDIVKEVRSQYDGFFLLDLVRPGTYTLRIDPDQLERLELPSVASRSVEIGKDGTILNGEDFVIGGDSADLEGVFRAYLASFASLELAKEAWAEIIATFPETFKTATPEYGETISGSGQTAIDLYAIPFISRTAAENACIGLRAEFGNTWCNPLEISIR